MLPRGTELKRHLSPLYHVISHDVCKDFQTQVSTEGALRQYIKDYIFVQIKSSQITWIRTRFRFKIVNWKITCHLLPFLSNLSLHKPDIPQLTQASPGFLSLCLTCIPRHPWVHRVVPARETLTGHHTWKRQLCPPPSVIPPNREVKAGKGEQRRKRCMLRS